MAEETQKCVVMSTLPTFLYGFNLIPIKVTATCLCQVGVDQPTLKASEN